MVADIGTRGLLFAFLLICVFFVAFVTFVILAKQAKNNNNEIAQRWYFTFSLVMIVGAISTLVFIYA